MLPCLTQKKPRARSASSVSRQEFLAIANKWLSKDLGPLSDIFVKGELFSGSGASLAAPIGPELFKSTAVSGARKW
jgi:hypothetical protein